MQRHCNPCLLASLARAACAAVATGRHVAVINTSEVTLTWNHTGRIADLMQGEWTETVHSGGTVVLGDGGRLNSRNGDEDDDEQAIR